MTRLVQRLSHKPMTLRAVLGQIVAHENLNFLLTNRIPRRLATRFMGWFSQIEQPLVRSLSMRVWRLFCHVDLSDAKETRFHSLHDCFIRELRPGARPIDPDPTVLVSPCDAIVGAFGAVAGTEVYQIKGFPYDLHDLVLDADLAESYRGGVFVTLRLTAGMYHHFHAPFDATIESVSYVSGDTWNVNPIALKRVEALFCKNERAVLRTRLVGSDAIVTMVPVAAILVASLRFRFLDVDLRKAGARTIPCDAKVMKGEELGWFQHGSTIVVLAPRGFHPCPGLATGDHIRMGQKLLSLPGATSETDPVTPV